MQKKTTHKLHTQLRAATIEPSSLNEEQRTAEVVFSTGAPVRRDMFFGEGFFEELSLDKDAVRLERLNNGAPLLNNHNSRELSDVIGVVESATVDGNVGIATVRFSERAEVEPIFKDVKAGIIRNISVGYRVHKFEEQTEERDGLKVLRATDWEPVEVSLVPAGADAGAGVRASDDDIENTCQVVAVLEVKENVREEPLQDLPGSDPEVKEAKTENTNSHSRGVKEMDKEKELTLKQEAVATEKRRQKDIRFAVKAAGLDNQLADELIDNDKTVEDARSLIIEKLAEKQKEVKTESAAPQVEVVRDAQDTFKEGVEEALLHRYRSKSETIAHVSGEIKMPGYELTEKGKPFAYRSLLDLVRMSLENKGVNTSTFTKQRLAERGMHTTSDFPEILANVANKTLRDGYAMAPRTWMPFTREVSVSDFKQISRTNLGEGETLDKVYEKGEIKRGTISENAEKYKVETYAKIVCISREAIQNDDMGAFTRVPERMGRRAADKESDVIWDLILSNPLMSDGLAVFDAGHGNLSGAAAAPSEPGLAEARLSMRLQLGLDGERISVLPRYVYVSPSDETAAEKLLATITPDSSTNVNPFSTSGRTPMQLGVEPRLEVAAGAQPWFVMADVGQIDMVELARLEGMGAPSIETRDGFDVLGTELRVVHDFGAAIIDFRGLFKNDGV